MAKTMRPSSFVYFALVKLLEYTRQQTSKNARNGIMQQRATSTRPRPTIPVFLVRRLDVILKTLVPAVELWKQVLCHDGVFDESGV